LEFSYFFTLLLSGATIINFGYEIREVAEG